MGDDKYLPCKLTSVQTLSAAGFDGALLVVDSVGKLDGSLAVLRQPVEEHLKLDKNALAVNSVSIISVAQDVLPFGRLILAATGPLDRDFDDIRRYADAAGNGTKRAIAAGVKNLLLVCPDNDKERYSKAVLVACLGALQTAYVPLELRELEGASRVSPKLDSLGVCSSCTQYASYVVRVAVGIEAARTVARDIAGSDPERMTPIKTVDYVLEAFPPNGASAVSVKVIDDQARINKEYPFLSAVNRAANVVPRHQARVIKLFYQGEGEVRETLLFVGKGVTIDTGGINVKTGGAMIGMSRDKSGAAAVAGFFKALDILKPKGLKVIGTLAMVRNSIGSEGYTCDEILTARSGRRVRIVNTDAEGRMVMLDPLCEMKELALAGGCGGGGGGGLVVKPHLFTIATLTGHAALTVGSGYSIAMDNGQAHESQEAEKLRRASEDVGDMVEVSILRREDYDFHRGQSEYEDLRQAAERPSGQLPRGHQGPAAFLIMGSGLEEHGVNSTHPLKYTHIDMAGAEGPFPGAPWGSPVTALAARFILPIL